MATLGEIAPLLDLGATGILLVATFWLLRSVVTGHLVPKRELDYLREDRDARLAEKNEEIASWRAAHETSETARDLLNIQNRELAEGLRTFDHFFSEIKKLAEKGSGPDVS
jgi:hypothetical protein